MLSSIIFVDIRKNDQNPLCSECLFGSKYEALQFLECEGNDLRPETREVKMKTFLQLAKTKPNETVVFSFITYKSKPHRQRVNEKVMKTQL